MTETVQFTPDAVREYLDASIVHWRKRRDVADDESVDKTVATCYVDAYQSVRVSLYGEALPGDIDTLANDWSGGEATPEPPPGNGQIGDPNR